MTKTMNAMNLAIIITLACVWLGLSLHNAEVMPSWACVHCWLENSPNANAAMGVMSMMLLLRFSGEFWTLWVNESKGGE